VLDLPEEAGVEAGFPEAGEVFVAGEVGKDLGDAGDGGRAVGGERQGALGEGLADFLPVAYGFTILAELAETGAPVEVDGRSSRTNNLEVEAFCPSLVAEVDIPFPAVGEAFAREFGRSCLGADPSRLARTELNDAGREQPLLEGPALSSMGSAGSNSRPSLARLMNPRWPSSMQQYGIAAASLGPGNLSPRNPSADEDDRAATMVTVAPP
jgi:hypothetical protein